MVLLLLTPFRVLITLPVTTDEPPSKEALGYSTGPSSSLWAPNVAGATLSWTRATDHDSICCTCCPVLWLLLLLSIVTEAVVVVAMAIVACLG